MADNSAFYGDLERTIQRLEKLQDQATVSAIERKGLEAVAEVVTPVMRAATPVSSGKRRGTTSLPVGALKASVRARILPEENGKPQAAVVDFGRNNHIARFLDLGTATIPEKGFVRRVNEMVRAPAEAAFVEEASAETDRVLGGK